MEVSKACAQDWPGQWVCPFFNLTDNVQLFSRLVMPIPTPTSSIEVLVTPHPLQHLGMTGFVNFGESGGYEIVLHCFHFHFPDGSWG